MREVATVPDGPVTKRFGSPMSRPPAPNMP